MSFPPLEQYLGFIFDLDGTLIDSMPHHVRAWIAVGHEHDFEVNPADIYAWGGVSSLDVVLKLKAMGCSTGDPQEFVRRKVQLYREHLSEVELFDDVAAILKDAHNRGLKTAIASGTQRINGLDALRIHGLESFVDAMVCGDDVVNHKPHPETFLKAAQKLSLAPSQCVVFEDGPLGVQAALAGGFDCIEVKNGAFVKQHLTDQNK